MQEKKRGFARSAERAASGFGSHLAVPEKPFGLTPVLRFFDRCGNCALPFSVPGSGSAQFPRRFAKIPGRNHRLLPALATNASPAHLLNASRLRFESPAS